MEEKCIVRCTKEQLSLMENKSQKAGFSSVSDYMRFAAINCNIVSEKNTNDVLIEERVKIKIRDGRMVKNILKKYRNEEQEHFILITLDNGNNLISETVVFKGTVDKTLVHPRDIFRIAIKDNAKAIIIAHNHPGKGREASRADIAITRRLQECSKIFGIELLDHVIVAGDTFFSFCDEGLL